MESKLRRVENLDRAVQQLMLKMDAMDRRTGGQSDTILAKLDSLTKSVTQMEAAQSRMDNLCSGRRRREKFEDEEDLVDIFDPIYIKSLHFSIRLNKFSIKPVLSQAAQLSIYLIVNKTNRVAPP